VNIRTPDGIIIHCLPEDARCVMHKGLSPEDMDSCPIRNFDDFGLECVPELCDYYTEGDADDYL
jgi:hypothetical protein